MKRNNNSSLLIPIHLRAFLHGKDYSEDIYSGFQYNFRFMGRMDIDNGLFVNKSSTEPGVHLHWSLPEGFASGNQKSVVGDDGVVEYSLEYPIVPNRWLISRLWLPNGGDKIKIKTFLVESDALLESVSEKNYNLNSPSWPHTSTSEKPSRFLGRAFPADTDLSLVEDVPRHRLTAISPVDPFFSAYYPSCRNVFGFHDNLSDENLENVNLNYLVCGWYQKTVEDEPFLSVDNAEELAEQLRMVVDSETLPGQTLCHGLICSLPWKDKNTLYTSGVPGQSGSVVSKPVFALGNTSSEALSALAGNGNTVQETVMHYFLNDLMPSLSNGTEIAASERELHSSGFSKISPPEIITIKKKKDKKTDENKNNEDVLPSPEIMNVVAEIRKTQRELNNKSAEIVQIQRSIYENWYLYRVDKGDIYKNNMDKYTAEAMKEARLWKDESDKLKTDINRLAQEIEEKTGYVLSTEPDQQYFAPTEPVLLIKQLANVEGKVGEDLLQCRISAQHISALNINGENGIFGDSSKASVSLEGKRFYNEPIFKFDLPADYFKLLNEAVLLSPEFAAFLSAKAFNAAGVKKEEQKTYLFENLKNEILRAQKNLSCNDMSFTGTVPCLFAVKEFSPQWYPLFIEWQANYYPDMALHSAKPAYDNTWEFSESSFSYKGEKISGLNMKNVSGRLLISDNASSRLEQMTEKHMEDLFDTVVSNPRSETLLSQSISGFNGHMLMKDQSNPLPLFESVPENNSFILKSLAPEAVATSPLYDNFFSPVRAGFLAFEKVRVLDRLGRLQHVENPEFYTPESMRQPGVPPLVKTAMLQPRLSQPSRLLNYWLTTKEENRDAESGFVESASPICGFLIPNRLDYSLMVYDTQGELRGSLNLTQTGENISWKSPPGESPSPHIPTDLDPAMYSFLKSLKENDSKPLAALLNYINVRAYDIIPSSSSISEIEFIGRPIALARAYIKLEQLGEFEKYRLYKRADQTKKTNISKAVFKLDVGNINDIKDGVVGFFHNDDYSKIHVLNDKPLPQNSYFIQDNRIDIEMDPEKHTELSILLDPWGYVSLLTGLLPDITLNLPEELVSAALNNIQASYFSSQVLCNPDFINIPIPRTDNSDFYFHYMDKETWKNSHIEHDNIDAFSTPYPFNAIEGYVKIHKKEK